MREGFYYVAEGNVISPLYRVRFANLVKVVRKEAPLIPGYFYHIDSGNRLYEIYPVFKSKRKVTWEAGYLDSRKLFFEANFPVSLDFFHLPAAAELPEVSF
jgi:hypothetical protein